MANYLKPSKNVELEKVRTPDETVVLGVFDKSSLLNFIQGLTSSNLVIYLYQDSDTGPTRIAIGEAGGDSLPSGRHMESASELPCPRWCPK
ncbi:MAG: hypothetical protein KatS3mg029_0902 [Saprospiraceae bacterium]|nr:MAG: hypothetical protein KatS3mg029_0902 [Saprospiraceae bacterium]